MRLLIYITKGNAVIQGDSLRCAAPRVDAIKKTCNKLIAKLNESGQIAGGYRCERCHQDISVVMKEPRTDL